MDVNAIGKKRKQRHCVLNQDLNLGLNNNEELGTH